MRIFIDSDVVISSLLSQSGAAYLLINTSSLQLFISSFSKRELEKVVQRLGIESEMLNKIVVNNLKIVNISVSLDEIKSSFGQYVTDVDDAHIVAGAKTAKAGFLITYNVRDYRIEKIKRDLNILILTPAALLQYLRSVA